MKNLILFVGILAIFSACSSIKVTSDYDKTADFSKYKTFEYYGWAEESDKILNQFDKERLEKAFAAEFAKRDLQLVKENGDMMVSLFIVVDQKTSVTAYSNNYGAGWGYGPRWGWYGGYGMGGPTTTTYSEENYQEGTLVVDVFDKAEKKLIWQGVGQKTVEENPNKRERAITYAAESIMKSFPIKPVSKK
jgi:hypothetical protein